MKLLLLTLATLFVGHSSFATTCEATKDGKIFESSRVGASDLMIRVDRRRFFWIGNFGSSMVSVSLNRPATKAEIAQALKDGERYSPNNSADTHVNLLMSDLVKDSAYIDGFALHCKQ